jgi:4-aminobutyrate aminotransferase-like enzyme
MIQVPEKKSKLVKSLLKELGVVIEPDAITLAKKLDNSIPKGAIPSMDEIVAEVRQFRAEK